MNTLNDKLSESGERRRKKVEGRAAELAAEAMGGDWPLIASFPNGPAVAVTGLAGIDVKGERTLKRKTGHRGRRRS